MCLLLSTCLDLFNHAYGVTHILGQKLQYASDLGQLAKPHVANSI